MGGIDGDLKRNSRQATSDWFRRDSLHERHLALSRPSDPRREEKAEPGPRPTRLSPHGYFSRKRPGGVGEFKPKAP